MELTGDHEEMKKCKNDQIWGSKSSKNVTKAQVKITSLKTQKVRFDEKWRSKVVKSVVESVILKGKVSFS